MRRSLALLAAVLGTALGAAGSVAQSGGPFRIATGAASGTYAAVGGILAQAMSGESGPRVAAQSSQGSVANVEAVATGRVESALSQADIAYWALTGTGAFEGKNKLDDLRAIANLYQESMHLVARKAAGIRTVADLRGKRVSIDQQGSGTLPEARLVLDAWGLQESDLRVENVSLETATQRLKDGSLDAFFYVGGYPVPALAALPEAGAEIDLVPIDGVNAEKLRGSYKFLAREEIPANIYGRNDPVRTLSVGATWITSAKVDQNLVYEVAKALWSDKTLAALANGHPKGKQVSRETALTGVSVPLHPGAERFYSEAGMLRK